MPSGLCEDRPPRVVKRLPVFAQHANGGDGFGGAFLAHQQIELIDAGFAQFGVSILLAQDLIGLPRVGEAAEVFEDIALEIVVFGLGGIEVDGVVDLLQRIGKLLLLDECLGLGEEGGRGPAQPPEGVVGSIALRVARSRSAPA